MCLIWSWWCYQDPIKVDSPLKLETVDCYSDQVQLLRILYKLFDTQWYLDPEYCRNYGVSFDDDLVTSLSEIISNYEIYKNEILDYPNNSSVMSSQFLRLFETLLNNKEEISKSRPKTSKFLVFIKFILFKKRKSIKIQLIQNIMKFKKYDKKTK